MIAPFMTPRSARLLATSLLLATGAAVASPVHAAEGDEIYSSVLVDRLEYQTNEGDDLLLWDAQGWVGGDLNKLWISLNLW